MQCPVDGETLMMTDRNGVEIDYCPKCRGVWLDRGELDKIIARGDAPATAAPFAAAPVRADPAQPVRLPEPGRETARQPEPRDHRRDDDRRDDDRRDDDRRDGPSRYDERRDQRAGAYAGDRRESSGEALGGLGGLGDLGDLLGRRDRSRSAPDPRSASSYPPKKRSSFFKDLLSESLGGE